jgi:hypothetical protein
MRVNREPGVFASRSRFSADCTTSIVSSQWRHESTGARREFLRTTAIAPEHTQRESLANAVLEASPHRSRPVAARARYHRQVRLREHYGRLDLGRRVAIRALVAFLVTFIVLRIVTAIIHFELFPHGPFRNLVTKSGLHIHHLFWGILLLMFTGFVALATRTPKWHLRIAIVFGIALALTLDEFALWLRLADVYWSPEGIESLKAAAVAAALLGLYAYGQPFWHAILEEIFKRR